jgi:outer membrane protein assembly factor BamA
MQRRPIILCPSFLFGVAFLCLCPLSAVLGQHQQIHSIEIIRKPILDHAGNIIDELVNGLHITTNESIIRRELLFAESEIYDPARVAETERNLRSMGIFSDVKILVDSLPGDLIGIRVITRERWTFSASAMITQEAGVRSKLATISDKNLLGNAQKISLNYDYSSLRVNDPNGFQASFEEGRFFGSRWKASVYSRHAEEYRATSIGFERPFYSEAAEWSGGAAVSKGWERQWYNPEAPYAAETFRQTSFFQSWYVRSVGSDIRFRFGGAYMRSRTTALPQYIGTTDNMDLVNVSAGILKREFAATSNVDEIGGVEYAQTGYAASLTTGFNPSSDPELRNAWFFRAGSKVGLNFMQDGHFFTDVSASAYTDMSRMQDMSIRGQVSFFNKVTNGSTLAGRAFIVHGSSWSPRKRVALGGLLGLRGYGPWEFVGTSAALMNIEYRVFPDIELMYFKSALVAFFDSGTTWWEHQRLAKQKWHSAAGVGVRIANRRFLGSSVIRIDLVYNLTTRQWGQIILSTNQIFRALGGVDTDSPTVRE